MHSRPHGVREDVYAVSIICSSEAVEKTFVCVENIYIYNCI